MSVRQPVRLLDIARLTEAYPLELLADFSTGNFTLVKQDGSTVEHKKPGTLTVKYGDSTLLNNGNLYDNLSITIPSATSISGNAETATRLATAVDIGITGGATGTPQSFDGSASINIPITSLDATKLSGIIPLSNIPNIPWENIDNKPTIYQPSTTTPKEAGTAAVGTGTTFARADHVHPLQTTVSGNAGTATKFSSSQTIALTGDVTGSASSQAGWSIATTLANSGVTSGSYGPSANASPSHGGKFFVPYVTVDAKGRVTSASTKTITLPTYSAMKGATANAAGSAGLVPAPASGKNTSFLRGDGTWATPSTDTYSAGTGLSLSGTTFNHSNSITAGTAQGDANKTLTFGGKFTIPKISYDAQGHITSKGTTTMTMPSAPTSVSGNAGTATKLSTARTLTIGNTGKAFDGSADVSWSLSEIGALPLAGGTLTGTLTSRNITVQSGYTLTVSTAGNVSGIAVKYTATIGTSWSGTAAPYSQTITVTGLKSTDVPLIDFVNSGTYATDLNREEAWGSIYRIVPANNKITVYAHEKTTTSCPIQLLVIR